MGLILHPDAQREYDEAIAWYEEDYPGRGRHFRAAVRGEIARIRAEGAHTFPQWRRTTFRAVVVPHFPYQVIFREEPDRVIVVYAVAHDKRRPGTGGVGAGNLAQTGGVTSILRGPSFQARESAPPSDRP